jgi:hypothetical protein
MAVGHRHQFLALGAARADVHPRVEVARAYFAEVGRAGAVDVADGVEVVRRVEGLSPRSGRQCRQKQYGQKSSHDSVSATSAATVSCTVS